MFENRIDHLGRELTVAAAERISRRHLLTSMGKLLVGAALAAGAASLEKSVASAAPLPLCVGQQRDVCGSGCGHICLCGGCCGGGNPCKCDKVFFIKRCDDYCASTGVCMSGWYCTGEQCTNGRCC